MSRLRIRVIITVLTLVGLGGNVTAEPNRPKRGRPHQQVPTGAEDSPAAPPTDAQLEADLERMTSRSSDGLVPVTRADGTVAVDLEGRFMSVMVAGPAGGAACHTGKAVVDASRARHKRGKQRVRRAARPAPAPAPAVPALEVM